MDLSGFITLDCLDGLLYHKLSCLRKVCVCLLDITVQTLNSLLQFTSNALIQKVKMQGIK